MLATLIDEPARVTPAQMDRWCRDFDNWGICDTACFALFDPTSHAWAKVEREARRVRYAQLRAQHSRGCHGPAPGRLALGLGAVGGKACAPGAYQCVGGQAARGPSVHHWRSIAHSPTFR